MTAPSMKDVQMSPRLSEMLFVATHSELRYQTTRESRELVRIAQARRYWCYSCGRSDLPYTDFDGSGTDLCVACYELAGLENSHSDGYHAKTPVAECPTCAEVAK